MASSSHLAFTSLAGTDFLACSSNQQCLWTSASTFAASSCGQRIVGLKESFPAQPMPYAFGLPTPPSRLTPWLGFWNMQDVSSGLAVHDRTPESTCCVRSLDSSVQATTEARASRSIVSILEMRSSSQEHRFSAVLHWIEVDCIGSKVVAQESWLRIAVTHCQPPHNSNTPRLLWPDQLV